MDALAQNASQAAPGNQGQRRYSTPRTLALSEVYRVSHDCIREHAFFKDSDPKFLEVVLETVRVQLCLPGEDIVKEGEKGDCIYFMYRGEVEVLVGENEVRVATLKDGSLFGEMALLESGLRKATIRAISICDCRIIDAKDFHILINRFPAERAKIAKLAKERLAERTKTAVGKFTPRRPSTETKQKFMRSAHTILVSRKLETLTRPTAAGDSDRAAIRRASTIEALSFPRSVRSPSPLKIPRSLKSATEFSHRLLLVKAMKAWMLHFRAHLQAATCLRRAVRAKTQPFNLDVVLDNYVPSNLGALTDRAPTGQQPSSSRLLTHRQSMPVAVKVDTHKPMQICISRRPTEPPADWAPYLRAPTKPSTTTSYDPTPSLLANLRDLRATWSDAL